MLRAIESAPLQPGIQLLIDRGMLSRAIADERPGEVPAFIGQIRAAVTRGEITTGQASTLRQMLGLRHAQPANDQGRHHGDERRAR